MQLFLFCLLMLRICQCNLNDNDGARTPMLQYKDREFLKSRNSGHIRTDSMNTQPDTNAKAPYFDEKMTAIMEQEILQSEMEMKMKMEMEKEIEKEMEWQMQMQQKKGKVQSQEFTLNQFYPMGGDDDNGDDPGPPNLAGQGSVLIRHESAQFYDHGVEKLELTFTESHIDQGSLLQLNGNIPENPRVHGVQKSGSAEPKDGNETNEGWEQPTGQQKLNGGDFDINMNMNINNNRSQNLLIKTPRSYNDNDSGIMHNEEKYDQLLSPRIHTPPHHQHHHRHYSTSSDDDDDGYGTTRGPSMMTMGGNMLNVLRFIPWNENEYLPQELDESYDERRIPRFPVNQGLNEVIRFHCNGDALLKCDALVIPITEDWTPISAESHKLMNNAGSEYLEWIYHNKKMGDYVSTGEAQECNSFNLPCKYIIHTCPPRYDDRYPVASENAMNSCYWRSLEIACDLECKTIVFPSIYPPKFFSEQLAIHILSRTLRRFLERYQSVSFESVVVCVDNEDQMQLYTRIFTIYFPRDHIDLKYSQKYMPAYTGNISGGTVVKIRRQKIELSPLVNKAQINNNNQRLSYLPNNSNITLINKNHIDYETYDIYGNLRPAIQSIVEYKMEPEKVWKAQENKKWGWQKVEESFEIRYKRYWNRCRKLNLHHIQLHQFVYVGGKDRDDRDIIIFVEIDFQQNI